MHARKLLIPVAIAALVAAAASSAATGSHSRAQQVSVSTSVLMPGVTYRREVDFTSRGPIVLDVVTAPKPDGTVYSFGPALSNNALAGTEKLTKIESRLDSGATTVGIDGDYFNRQTGAPTGIVLQGGVLESQPAGGRSSLGIGANGVLTAGRVSFSGAWQGNGLRRPLLLNTAKGNFTLYTPAYGAVTPTESGVVEDVIGSFPPARLGQALDGTVTQVTSAGPTRIPSGGAVLVARGAQSTAQLRAEAPAGQEIAVGLSLSPSWNGLASAIGGGPLLLKNGKPVFHANESFDPRSLNTREARGAVGQLADGRIVLVSVEGASPAYSLGMSNYELAVELSQLGAKTGYGLGAGNPAGMAFDGTLLTRPSARSEAKLSDALVLSYTGVYAAPPSAPVLSPNSDGVADTETLGYKLVRPANVVAALAGPGGSKITLANDAEQPGLHAVSWNGSNGGKPAPEGRWTFTVTAVDDRGITTTAQRTFSLDDTLTSLAVATGSGGRPTATFRLTRTADVVVLVERPSGVPVAQLLSGSLGPGLRKASWKGRIGGRVASGGRYQLVVEATSSVGVSSLTAPFSFRPHRRH